MVARHLYIAASIWSETTQTEQALMFPSDDSVRRLGVPAGDDDANFPVAQESIIRCLKDQQDNPSVKKWLQWLPRDRDSVRWQRTTLAKP
jgi:hypothetical protein